MASPLESRRLWFAGIGGAGMSGYALLAHAWGAEVCGWDRNATPYLGHLPADIRVDISDTPAVPAGWEPIISTAYADTRPVAENNSAENRAKNRRVEIVVLRDNPPAPAP